MKKMRKTKWIANFNKPFAPIDYAVTDERVVVVRATVETGTMKGRDQSSGAAALFGADAAQTLRSRWKKTKSSLGMTHSTRSNRPTT